VEKAAAGGESKEDQDGIAGRNGCAWVDTLPIRRFLGYLGERTGDGWQCLLLTTNWDSLLEREIDIAFPRCPLRQGSMRFSISTAQWTICPTT